MTAELHLLGLSSIQHYPTISFYLCLLLFSDHLQKYPCWLSLFCYSDWNRTHRMYLIRTRSAIVKWCHSYPCWNRLLLPQHIVMNPTVCNPISILVLINYSERHSPRVGRHEPTLVLYRRKERVITIHIAQIVSIIRNGNSIQFDPRINSFKCEINFLSFYLRNWQVGCGGHIRFVVSSPKIIILLYKSEWQRPDSRQDNIETLPVSFKWAH